MEGRQTLDALGRVVTATLLMAIVVMGVRTLGQHTGLEPPWLVVLGGLTGTLVYLGAGRLLDVRALRWLSGALAK